MIVSHKQQRGVRDLDSKQIPIACYKNLYSRVALQLYKMLYIKCDSKERGGIRDSDEEEIFFHMGNQEKLPNRVEVYDGPRKTDGISTHGTDRKRVALKEKLPRLATG